MLGTCGQWHKTGRDEGPKMILRFLDTLTLGNRGLTRVESQIVSIIYEKW